MSDQLLEIFKASNGIVCCVGAGGKKTTMFKLASEHTGKIGITATSHIEYFPRTLNATRYIATQDELINKIKADHDSRIIAFAQPCERRGRYTGIDKTTVNKFRKAGGFDLLLVKSDGARSRLLKAPAEHEPPLPDTVNTVIAVVSAKVIGKRLTEKIAHRLDKISAVAGINENEKIQALHVARILSSSNGSLKNTGNAKVVPLINMVDDSEREKLARETAKITLSLTDRFEYVVLAAMRNQQPVIDIISR